MQTLLRPLLLVSIVLLVPIVPFVVFGEQLETWFHTWSEQPASRRVVAAVVVGLLATDIVLPIPSSLVSTFGGGQLGTLGGTLASWVGMTVAAVLGFALGAVVRARGDALAEPPAGRAAPAAGQRSLRTGVSGPGARRAGVCGSQRVVAGHASAGLAAVPAGGGGQQPGDCTGLFRLRDPRCSTRVASLGAGDLRGVAAVVDHAGSVLVAGRR